MSCTGNSSETHGHPSNGNKDDNQQDSIYDKWNIARIHGWTGTPCGYCDGDRAYVLSHSNPAPGQVSSCSKDPSYVSKTNSGFEKNENGSFKTHIEVSSSDDGGVDMIELELTSRNRQNDNDSSDIMNNDDKKLIKENASTSYGATFSHLNCSDYQILIDSGWRRSGKFLYLPDNWKTCCPAIPIRLNTLQFRPSKSQRKIWRILRSIIEGSQLDVNVDDKAKESTVKKIQTTQQRKKQRMCNKNKFNNHNMKTFTRNQGSTSDNLQQPLTINQVETILHRSGLLQFLQQKTFDLLIQEQEQQHCWKPVSIEKSWCQYKINKNVFFSKRKQKKESITTKQLKHKIEKPEQFNVMVISKVCAAVAGRCRGEHPNIIATSIVAKLKNDILSNPTFFVHDDNNDGHHSIQTEPMITSVACHEKSGQIQINISLKETTALKDGIEGSEKYTMHKRENLKTKNATEFVSYPSIMNHHRSSSSQLNSSNENDGIHLRQRFSHERNPEKETINNEQNINYGNGYVHSRDDTTSDTLLCLNWKNRNIFTVRSIPSELSAQDPDVCRLYAKYQQIIHGDNNPFPDDHENINIFSHVNKSVSGSRHKAKNMRNVFTSAQKKKFKSFRRFLCDTPLPTPTSTTTSSMNGNFDMDADGYDIHIPYGSYHQQYRINNKLVAVGVVDILPQCLSSVYSFYDPILSKKLQLGTLTALREIEWVKRASTFRPDLKYYYLGYYIHSCGKMRYKADFKPSMLLCPTYKKWVDFEEAKEKLNRLSPIRHCCTLATVPSSNLHLDNLQRESEIKTVSNSKNPDKDSNMIGEETSKSSSSSPYAMQVENDAHDDFYRKTILEGIRLDISPREDNRSKSKKTNNDFDGDDDDICNIDVLNNSDNMANNIYEHDDDIDDDDDDESVNDEIKMENIITVSDLTSHGRELVDDHVNEFINAIGDNLCKRCIIRL